ncbi:MAG: FG-GAP repeat domain-containing protein [Pyrinomonadaceae bacterium]
MKTYFVQSILLVCLLFSSFALPQERSVPIVDLRLGGLIGGSQNGAWVEPGLAAESILNSVMDLNVFGFGGKERKMIYAARRAPIEDVCQDFYRVNMGMKERLGLAIGSNAKWKPMPRIPKRISARNAVYKRAVASFLKKQGVKNPIVRITQAFQIDLDGDGQDEVVITATRASDRYFTKLNAGDYSLVLLRTVTKAEVTDLMVDGNIYKPDQEDVGPPHRYEISGIADLNGDGTMEVAIYAEYYEGAGTAAFELRGGKLEMIKEVQAGCGV